MRTNNILIAAVFSLGLWATPAQATPAQGLATIPPTTTSAADKPVLELKPPPRFQPRWAEANAPVFLPGVAPAVMQSPAPCNLRDPNGRRAP